MIETINKLIRTAAPACTGAGRELRAIEIARAWTFLCQGAQGGSKSRGTYSRWKRPSRRGDSHLGDFIEARQAGRHPRLLSASTSRSTPRRFSAPSPARGACDQDEVSAWKNGSEHSFGRGRSSSRLRAKRSGRIEAKALRHACGILIALAQAEGLRRGREGNVVSSYQPYRKVSDRMSRTLSSSYPGSKSDLGHPSNQWSPGAKFCSTPHKYLLIYG